LRGRTAHRGSVTEGRVLLGVEDLEERRGRITLDAHAQLVDLVEHQHRVAGAGLADRLHDVAGQRANIGAAVAADLGLVVRAAQAHALELDPERARDALAERGLPDAGRPDETEDRTAALRVELAHRQVLDDAPLDLLETVVIGVEDAARPPDVDVLGVELRPRHGDQRVEVCARHRVLAARLVHALETLQLLAGMLLDIRRHPGLGDRLGQLSGLIGALTVLAQFLADLAHLLAKQDFLLPVVERFLGLLLDLPRELEHLDAPGEQV